MPKTIFDKNREYFQNPSLSQSQLKALMTGLGTYKTKDPDCEDDEHFILGSAVDCLLLTPTLFDKEYYISPFENKPSDKVMSILRNVYVKKVNENLADNRHLIWEACNVKEYYPNRAKSLLDDKRPDDIIKKGLYYWNDLIKSNNRTIISSKELEIINSCTNSLLTNTFTSKYFEESDNTHHIAQLPVYFSYKEIDCKALIDLIIIDHSLKTIQPIDIKTIGESTKAFPKNVKRFRYDIQAAWYTIALKSLEKVKIGLIDIDISDYKILPFKFIVESTQIQGYPLVYTLSDRDLQIAISGVEYKQKVYNLDSGVKGPIEMIKGIDQGIELYKWHQLHDQWEYDKHIYESNGDITMSLWGI